MKIKFPEIAILDNRYKSYNFEKYGYHLSIYNSGRDDIKYKFEFAKNA